MELAFMGQPDLTCIKLLPVSQSVVLCKTVRILSNNRNIAGAKKQEFPNDKIVAYKMEESMLKAYPLSVY